VEIAMNTSRLIRLAAALSLAALGGCIIAPAAPYGGEVVAVPPPAPVVEVMPPPPVVGWIWIAGFWNWYGGRHVWVPGRWEAPRPGWRWVPHRWEPISGGGGYRGHGGRWERDVR
jgi:hypothetical protein